MNYTEAVAAALSELVGLDQKELLSLLETPKNASMGDIAFPCFKLSKVLRKAPNAIAAELKEKLSLPAGIEKAEVVHEDQLPGPARGPDASLPPPFHERRGEGVHRQGYLWLRLR